LASNLCIASVNSASIVISARNGVMDARSSCMVARIGGACITVITVDIFGENSSQNIAENNLAFVWVCCIECIDVLWNIFASSLDIARIISARVLVITSDHFVNDCSSVWVARISGASIVVINNLVGADTSTVSSARIISAWVVVIAVNSSVDASLDNITRIFGAFACISAISDSVDTFSSVEVARIDGACIVVVTADIRVDTFSGFTAALDGLAWNSSARNWSVDTVSINAFVSGAQVLVITNLSSVDASSFWVA
jgi:hypothetical protein